MRQETGDRRREAGGIIYMAWRSSCFSLDLSAASSCHLVALSLKAL